MASAMDFQIVPISTPLLPQVASPWRRRRDVCRSNRGGCGPHCDGEPRPRLSPAFQRLDQPEEPDRFQVDRGQLLRALTRRHGVFEPIGLFGVPRTAGAPFPRWAWRPAVGRTMSGFRCCCQIPSGLTASAARGAHPGRSRASPIRPPAEAVHDKARTVAAEGLRFVDGVLYSRPTRAPAWAIRDDGLVSACLPISKKLIKSPWSTDAILRRRSRAATRFAGAESPEVRRPRTVVAAADGGCGFAERLLPLRPGQVVL